MELDLYLMEFEEEGKKAINNLEKQLSKINTGRANPQLVAYIKMDYFGELTPIEQVSSISSPEAQQLLIKPFDIKISKDIAAAITKHNLDVQVNNEGNQVRIIFPALTQERRRDLVKSTHKILEETKVKIRLIRQEINKNIKSDEELSEDDEKHYQKEVQNLTDVYNQKVDQIGQEKAKDLMTI